MQVHTLLHQPLRDAARHDPQKCALICGGRRMSYRELADEAGNLSTDLRERGLQRGDRVLILLPNCPAAAVSIYATLEAGGVFSVINASVKPGKLDPILANCEPAFVITDAAGLRKLSAIPERLPSRGVYVTGDAPCDTISFDQACRTQRTATRVGLIDVDLAAIIYTSGTTSVPKGVTLSHRNMVSASRSIAAYLELSGADTILSPLPLSFDYGLYQLLLSVSAGATLCLQEGFGFPFELLRSISSFGVTVLPCVPTMMAVMLRLQEQSGLDLSSVRAITNTGAALPGAWIPRLQGMFPAAQLFSMYGLTECKRVSWLPPDELATRPDSVGHPIDCCEVFVADEHGHFHDRDATGELVVRGANVMCGYWRDPEASAKVLRDGPHPWEKVLFTGDLFRIDADGYLYFLGRMDQVFKSRGERVSPREIEVVLYAIQGVGAVRVTPVPDPLLGNAIRAEVVCEGRELTVAEVKRHCRERLEDRLVPGLIEIVDRLPISDAGKVKSDG